MQSPGMNPPQNVPVAAPSRLAVKILFGLVMLASFSPLLRAGQPWREVTVPTVAEAAASFAQPPMEYRAIHWAIWGGQQSKEHILADIGRIYTNGGGVYMINNSRGLRPKYFTPEYFDLVKFTVEECKKRGMKVWIEGDAGYPDGFAGGMISRHYPQLGMQGVVADLHYTVAAGQTLAIPLPEDILGILASPRAEAATNAELPAETGTEIPLPADGKFKWTAPSGGASEVIFHCPVADARYSLVAGQTLEIPLPPATRSIVSNSAGGGRTVQMDGSRHGNVGADFYPACPSQFADALRESRRRHQRQGQSLLAD
jgi:hypothetical protein